MGKEVYLFAGNVIVWVGIGLYVAFLAASQKRLQRRVNHLEAMRDDD